MKIKLVPGASLRVTTPYDGTQSFVKVDIFGEFRVQGQKGLWKQSKTITTCVVVTVGGDGWIEIDSWSEKDVQRLRQT